MAPFTLGISAIVVSLQRRSGIGPTFSTAYSYLRSHQSHGSFLFLKRLLAYNPVLTPKSTITSKAALIKNRHEALILSCCHAGTMDSLQQLLHIPWIEDIKS
jgi:hypothetical protein